MQQQELEGWRAKHTREWDKSPCPNCLHPLTAHFWWERGGQVGAEMMRGCHDCARDICQNVREETRMSSINICERCGSLMIAKALGRIEFVKAPGEAYEATELCPKCVGELVTFLAEKPGASSTPFTEPWKPAEKSEALLMLEAGPCGIQLMDGDGVEFMCLRPRGHKGYHIDGTKEWL